MALGYDIRLNAMLASSGGFDVSTGRVSRPYRGLSYWTKGYMSGGAFQVAKNVWHTVYALGSLALAGLGMYAAIEGMIGAFENPQVNSFSCKNPLDLSGL